MSADVLCVIRQLVVREKHSWHQLAQAPCQTHLLSHIAVPVKKQGKALSRLFIQKFAHMLKVKCFSFIKLAWIADEFWLLILLCILHFLCSSCSRVCICEFALFTELIGWNSAKSLGWRNSLLWNDSIPGTFQLLGVCSAASVRTAVLIQPHVSSVYRKFTVIAS